MRFERLLTIPVVFAALVFGAPGCGQKKVNECNALIQVINQGVQNLEKTPKIEVDASGVADLKSMADSMEKVAGDAAKVELTIPELKKMSTEYQAMAKEVATSAREMATAAEAKDATKMSTAQTAMEKAVKAEDPLVDSINKFCQAP